MCCHVMMTVMLISISPLAEAERVRAERGAAKKAEREEREQAGLSDLSPVVESEPTLNEQIAAKEKAVPFRKNNNNNDKQLNQDQPHDQASNIAKDEL